MVFGGYAKKTREEEARRVRIGGIFEAHGISTARYGDLEHGLLLEHTRKFAEKAAKADWEAQLTAALRKEGLNITVRHVPFVQKQQLGARYEQLKLVQVSSANSAHLEAVRAALRRLVKK